MLAALRRLFFDILQWESDEGAGGPAGASPCLVCRRGGLPGQPSRVQIPPDRSHPNSQNEPSEWQDAKSSTAAELLVDRESTLYPPPSCPIFCGAIPMSFVFFDKTFATKEQGTHRQELMLFILFAVLVFFCGQFVFGCDLPRCVSCAFLAAALSSSILRPYH